MQNSSINVTSEQHFVTGKNILITGCTSGIGEAFARMIAELRPSKIFLVAKSKRRGQVLLQDLKLPKHVKSQILVGDMGSMTGAQRVADAMLAAQEPLHIVFWNGIVWEALQDRDFKVGREEHLEPGFCSHFTTNYLSMVILCTRLKPLLEQNAHSRIIITGCATHMDVAKGEAKIDEQLFAPSQLQGLKTANLPSKDEAFAQTKLLQYMWAKKFAMTLGPNVALMVYNPGQLESTSTAPKILRKMIGHYGESFYNSITGLRTPKDSATVALWCADSPDAASANGKYVDFGTLGSPKVSLPCELGFSPSHSASSSSIMDPNQLERLWTLTQKFLSWQHGYHQQLHSNCDADHHSHKENAPGHKKITHQSTQGRQLASFSESEKLPNLLTSRPTFNQEAKIGLKITEL